MTTITRHRGRMSIAISLIAALLLAMPVHSGRAASTGVVSPDQANTRTGNTYGGWSAAWWQYVLSQPKSSNPLLNRTGADCGVNQSGPVFYLVGVNSSGSATRNACTVPANKYLFFPLVNSFDVHVACTQDPAVCDKNDTPDKVWHDLEVTGKFSISSSNATIDGGAASGYRACAGPDSACSASWFSLTLPDNNILGIPAGTYAPAVADGVYLLLAPLTPGRHTITFGGSGYAFGSFSQDITYNLTVSS